MATLNDNLDKLMAERQQRSGSASRMPAARTEELQPSAWLEESEAKPSAAIVIGLRTPCDKDYSTALEEPDDTAIMMSLVSVGICDPNDCRLPHPSFPMSDINIKALKPVTIRYLFDRIKQLHIETSPIVPLATDEELFILGDALQGGARLESLAQSNPGAAASVRRLCTAVFEELGLGLLDDGQEMTIDTSPVNPPGAANA